MKKISDILRELADDLDKDYSGSRLLAVEVLLGCAHTIAAELLKGSRR